MRVNNDAQLVADIQRFILDAAHIVSKGEEVFFEETPDGRILREAAHTIIINIATAAARLSDHFMHDHQAINWDDMRAMRNRIAHDYMGVNEEFVWATLVTDLPELGKQLNEFDT